MGGRSQRRSQRRRGGPPRDGVSGRRGRPRSTRPRRRRHLPPTPLPILAPWRGADQPPPPPARASDSITWGAPLRRWRGKWGQPEERDNKRQKKREKDNSSLASPPPAPPPAPTSVAPAGVTRGRAVARWSPSPQRHAVQRWWGVGRPLPREGRGWALHGGRERGASGGRGRGERGCPPRFFRVLPTLTAAARLRRPRRGWQSRTTAAPPPAPTAARGRRPLHFFSIAAAAVSLARPLVDAAARWSRGGRVGGCGGVRIAALRESLCVQYVDGGATVGWVGVSVESGSEGGVCRSAGWPTRGCVRPRGGSPFGSVRLHCVAGGFGGGCRLGRWGVYSSATPRGGQTRDGASTRPHRSGIRDPDVGMGWGGPATGLSRLE